MTDKSDTDMALQIKRDLNPRADIDEAFKVYDQRQREEDQARADELGIPVEIVESARILGEDAEEMAALQNCATQDQVIAALKGLADRQQARAEAEHAHRVAEEAKRL